MVDLRAAFDEVISNSYPDTVLQSAIDRWEESLFGFTKPGIDFTQRKTELLDRFNEIVTMSVPEAIALAEQITGETPIIIRNTFSDGWVLDTDKSILDISLSSFFICRY